MKKDEILKIISHNREIMLLFLFGCGIMLRYCLMAMGHNADFESYCIVGELASNGDNVYSNTSRYNYGPIFFIIQGICYRLSMLSLNPIWMFRILLVTVFTLGDILTAIFLMKKYSAKAAFLFFLNPVAIFITGYHNQFDNLAVLLMLFATLFYNTEERINKKDIGFIICFSLSLIMKHIFFLMPIWILLTPCLPKHKKIIYSVVPPSVFLLSFLPYVWRNKAALLGVIDNVFLYRSYNNAPLLKWLYNLLHINEQYYIFIFALLVISIGFIFRNKDFKFKVLIYSLVLVAFSSAVANQYLVIPLVALCVLSKYIKYLYTIIVTFFLITHYNGFRWYYLVPENSFVRKFLVEKGYSIACFLVLLVVIKELVLFFKVRNQRCVINKEVNHDL